MRAAASPSLSSRRHLLATLALLELAAPLIVMASLRVAGEIDVQRQGSAK